MLRTQGAGALSPYLFIAIAGLAGFTIFADQLLSASGVHTTVFPFVFFALSGLTCIFVPWKDIRPSSL